MFTLLLAIACSSNEPAKPATEAGKPAAAAPAPAAESGKPSAAAAAAMAISDAPAAPAGPVEVPATGPWAQVAADKVTTTSSGLSYAVLTPGKGAEAAPGKMVFMHYTGWLLDGTKFDSSLDRGKPFSFPLGAGRVIPGWDEGVAGMKIGEKRQLRIPPKLGYGARGAGGVIPPGATLVFDVELLDVK